tara:strand:- start:649 stop:987 length:339 start_codon:yes stop_codon:yes gene_type:complete
MKAKDFLAKYTSAFSDELESAQRRVADWQQVLIDLHTDRGSLLGSEEYSLMLGAEKRNALGGIDNAIADARKHIQDIRDDLHTSVHYPKHFKYRTKRIRNRLINQAIYMGLI